MAKKPTQPRAKVRHEIRVLAKQIWPQALYFELIEISRYYWSANDEDDTLTAEVELKIIGGGRVPTCRADSYQKLKTELTKLHKAKVRKP